MIHNSSFAGSTRFSVRGKVVENIEQTTGFWIFKKTYPGIEVEIDSKQLKIAEEKYGKVTHFDGKEFSIPKTIRVFFPERQEALSVGVEVGVTFAKGGPADQFFRGAEMLMVLSVVKIEEDTSLENEILPVQMNETENRYYQNCKKKN